MSLRENTTPCLVCLCDFKILSLERECNMNFHVIVIGAGGTGGFFIKEFGRFMASFKSNRKGIVLTIIDGDKVETKNLDRQSFQKFDVDTFKANSLCMALKECFGLKNVYSYPIYIDDEKQLAKIVAETEKDVESDYPYKNIQGTPVKGRKWARILVGAVDNHRARQVMHKYFAKEKNIFYYDSANEYEGGEVVFSGKVNGSVLAPPRAHYFPGIMKSRAKRASEISCGEINKQSPQHIVTNMMAGNLLLSKTIQLITDNKVDLGIAYFNAFEGYSSFYSVINKETGEQGA